MGTQGRAYSFNFPIFNPTGSYFVAVHLEFNCEITINNVDGISLGTPAANFIVSGSGSRIIDIKFQLRKIGAEGVRIGVSANSAVSPRIQKVQLTLDGGEGPFNYSATQIQNLNDTFFPE